MTSDGQINDKRVEKLMDKISGAIIDYFVEVEREPSLDIQLNLMKSLISVAGAVTSQAFQYVFNTLEGKEHEPPL